MGTTSITELNLGRPFNQKSPPFIRNGPVADSTLFEIKNVIAEPQEVQGLQINIGQGLDWWMTRLYFLSSLAADLTLIEVVVFVGGADTFIGMANPKKDRPENPPAFGSGQSAGGRGLTEHQHSRSGTAFSAQDIALCTSTSHAGPATL